MWIKLNKILVITVHEILQFLMKSQPQKGDIIVYFECNLNKKWYHSQERKCWIEKVKTRSTSNYMKTILCNLIFNMHIWIRYILCFYSMRTVKIRISNTLECNWVFQIPFVSFLLLPQFGFLHLILFIIPNILFIHFLSITSA